jgi:hypothetical protein
MDDMRAFSSRVTLSSGERVNKLCKEDIEWRMLVLQRQIQCLDASSVGRRNQLTSIKSGAGQKKKLAFENTNAVAKNAKGNTGFLYRRRRTLALDEKQQVVFKAQRARQNHKERRSNLRKLLVDKALEQSGIEKLFNMIDTDGSGGLSLDEWKVGLQRLTMGRGMLAATPRTRSNLSGLSLLNEDLTGMGDLHQEIDTNGDGVVDLQELTMFIRKKNETVSRPSRPNRRSGPVDEKVAKMTLRRKGWSEERAGIAAAKQQAYWPHEVWGM